MLAYAPVGINKPEGIYVGRSAYLCVHKLEVGVCVHRVYTCEWICIYMWLCISECVHVRIHVYLGVCTHGCI